MRWLDSPGTTGNFTSTPDAAANRITGDLAVHVKLSLPNWASLSNAINILASKWGGANNFGWEFYLNSTGNLAFASSKTGADVPVNNSSSVATGFSANTINWLGVALLVSTGQVTYYTSSDGSSWSQLGNLPAAAGLTSIFQTTAAVRINSRGDNTNYLGAAAKIHRVRILSGGINGTVVNDFDASLASDGATSVVATTGETWTLSTSGSPHERFEDDLSMLAAPAAVASVTPALLTAIQMASALAAQAGFNPAITTQILLTSGPSALATWIGSLNTAIMGAAAAAARATLIADLRVLQFDPEFVIAGDRAFAISGDRDFDIKAARSFSICSR